MKNKLGLCAALGAALMMVGSAEAAGLKPTELTPLPLGAIRPDGWLKLQLDQMSEGLVGHLYEHSEFLRPENGWITGTGFGWEEQPYWFRGFVKMAVLTQNKRCLKVAQDWVEKMLASRDGDGWFGPQSLKAAKASNGKIISDIWGHMVMCEALMSWYEVTGDTRVRDMLIRFFRFCEQMENDRFIIPEGGYPRGTSWHYTIQYDRAGDLFPCLFRVYEETHDEVFLRLADRLFKKLKPAEAMWVDSHNVNFAQRFPYTSLYWRRSGNPAHRASADFWYDLHMASWGQMPRCAFASDERTRMGCTDPRYATETCTWHEFVRSFQLMSDTTGETKWADRTEDVVFNQMPSAFTPGWTELHYLTAPNQVNLDARTDHNYFNGPPMIAYSAKLYRCCRHNAHYGMPLFTESLVKKSADGALVFWMYAPNHGTTQLNGADIAWEVKTCYPFRETVDVTVKSAKPAKLRFRVPGWATSFTVAAGANKATAAAPTPYAELDVPAGETKLSLVLGTEAKFTYWPRTGAVTVDRGPLSYSLAIGEKYGRIRRPQRVGGSIIWKEEEQKGTRHEDFMTEVFPTTPWNYGLDTSKPIEFRTCAWKDDCFLSTNAPCEIFVTGRRLPTWTLQDNQPAALQPSPALSSEPLERLRFVPMGCQRLRLTVLPQVTDDAALGRVWKPVPATTKRSERRR